MGYKATNENHANYMYLTQPPQTRVALQISTLSIHDHDPKPDGHEQTGGIAHYQLAFKFFTVPCITATPCTNGTPCTTGTPGAV